MFLKDQRIGEGFAYKIYEEEWFEYDKNYEIKYRCIITNDDKIESYENQSTDELAIIT